MGRQIEQLERVLKQPSTLRRIKQEYQHVRKSGIVVAEKGKDRVADNFYEVLPDKAAAVPEEEKDIIDKSIEAAKIIFLPGNIGKAILDRVSYALGISESSGSAAFVGLNL